MTLCERQIFLKISPSRLCTSHLGRVGFENARESLHGDSVLRVRSMRVKT